jgi:hypothetical protein
MSVRVRVCVYVSVCVCVGGGGFSVRRAANHQCVACTCVRLACVFTCVTCAE